MERYNVEGQLYDVAPHRLNDFLNKFPNAAKVESLEKTSDVATQDAPVASKKNMASSSVNYFSESLSTRLAIVEQLGKADTGQVSPLKQNMLPMGPEIGHYTEMQMFAKSGNPANKFERGVTEVKEVETVQTDSGELEFEVGEDRARSIEEINQVLEDNKKQLEEAQALEEDKKRQEEIRVINSKIAAATNNPQYKELSTKLQNLPVMSTEAVEIQEQLNKMVEVEYEKLYDTTSKTKSDYDYVNNLADDIQKKSPKTTNEVDVYLNVDGEVIGNNIDNEVVPDDAVKVQKGIRSTPNYDNISFADKEILTKKKEYERVLEIYTTTEGLDGSFLNISVGDLGPLNGFNYLPLNDLFDGFDLMKNIPEKERFEVAEEIKREIIGIVSNLEEGNGIEMAMRLDKAGSLKSISLQERKRIIQQAQNNVLNRRTLKANKGFEEVIEKQKIFEANYNIFKNDSEEKIKEYSLKFQDINNKFEILGPVDENSPIESIEAYNNLINQYQALNTEYSQTLDSFTQRENFLRSRSNNVNGLVESITEDYVNSLIELDYNAITQEFNNKPFEETTQAFKEYKERFYNRAQNADNAFAGWMYRNVDTALLFGEKAINQLSYINPFVFGTWLGGTLTDVFDLDDMAAGPGKKVTNTDVIMRQLFPREGFVNFYTSEEVETIKREDFDRAIKTDFKSFLNEDYLGRKAFNTIATLIPYVYGVAKIKTIKSIKDVPNLYKNGYKKFFNKSKGVRKVRSNVQVARDYNMLVNTQRMLTFDMYHMGLDNGLSKEKALVFGSVSSTITGLTQMIMPDQYFFSGAKANAVLKTFSGSLARAKNKEAANAAVGTFVKNIFKEIGEEELDYFAQETLKHASFLHHDPQYLNAAAHMELMFATIGLSGSIGSVGATRQYKAEKKRLDKMMLSERYEIDAMLQDRIETARRKADIIKKLQGMSQAEKNRRLESLQEDIDQAQTARTYNTTLRTAQRIAPKYVNYEQLELIRQRVQLENELKGTKTEFEKKEIREKIKGLETEFENAKVQKVADQNLDETIKSVEEITQGVNFLVADDVTQAENIIRQLNEAAKETNKELGYDKMQVLDESQIKEAAEQEGFNFDGVKIINKEVARSTNATNVAAHELLHDIVRQTVEANPEVAQRIAQAYGELLMSINPEQVLNSTFKRKLDLYQTTQNDVRRIIAQNPGATDVEIQALIDQQVGRDVHQQAIEVLTLASDAFATGDLDFDQMNKRGASDILRRVQQNLEGTFLNRWSIEVEFNDANDVFNFIKDYNVSIKKGKLTKAQKKLFDQKIEGKLTEGGVEVDSRAIQESRSERAYQTVESRKEALLNPKTTDRTAIQIAFDLQNDIERRMQFLEGIDISEVALEFMTDTESERGLPALLRKYNPQRNESIMGYLNAFVPGTGRSLLDVRLQEFYEKDPRYANIIQSTTEESTGRKVEQQQQEEKDKEEKERLTKLKVLTESLNVVEQVQQEVKDANIDEAALTRFGDVPNAAANTVGELFGISPKKIKSKANLTGPEVRAAQQFILKNAQLILDALPQGFDSDKKSTGVPRTILNALYNKRSSRAKTKAGEFNQIKRNNIKVSELLELVDIVDGTPTRNRNTSARIIALADLLGKVMTNQQLRINNPALARISDGMSPVMFSKSLNQDRSGVIMRWPGISQEYGYDQMDLTDIDGDRQAMIDWIKEVGSKDMPLSFWKTVLVGSGGKGTRVDIDGVRVRRYDLLDGSTILETDPNFEASRINHVPASPKHLFANVDQMLEAFKDIEFVEETDLSKALAGRKRYSKQSNEWAQKQFNNPKVIKFLNDSQAAFINTWLTIQEGVKNKEARKYWAAILETTAVGQNNFIRTNSTYGFHNTLGLENREEHAAPATEHAQVLWTLALDGVLTEGLLQTMNENFVQGALPKIFDDLLGDYKDAIPSEYHHDVLFGRIPYWIRYINPVVNKQKYELDGKFYYGINPNVITLPGNVTLAQEFSVGVDESLHMNQDVISMQQDLLFDIFLGNITQQEARSKINKYVNNNSVKVKTELDTRLENSEVAYRYSRSERQARGASVFDFDETLIIDGENFIIATNPETNEKIRISSASWPIRGPQLAAQGYEFDFTDFVNVRGGVDGPLLQKMKNQINKYGVDNVFVLTARPAESATAIHEWLKTKGISIPFKNITGLGNSTGDAKAAWMLDKYEEGYNDMYFVDDALPNVEAVQHVFDQLDIKGKSVQARIDFSKSLNSEFNNMLERTKGVEAVKTFSRVEAMKRGKNIGGFKIFIPPSAEDFTGLLRYFVGKGKQGDADIKFFEEALVKPFARADREMAQMKQGIRDQYKALGKKFPSVKKKLGKLTDEKGFTFDNAIRVYLFNKAGYEIPGLSKTAEKALVRLVKGDADLRAYADAIGAITKQKEGYIAPDEYWNVGNIAQDLQNVVNKVSRKQFLEEWKSNVDEIFTPENLNKIEAVYGSDFRSALQDILYRMESGQNRRRGATKFENQWNNWINNSVGAIMFFNARSAVLQTISTVNFINFDDNNIFAAGKAFANQKQYWKDFSFLFNSDFLRNRRAGLATNVNEAELASAVAGAKNKAKAALQYLLKIGFTPTQIADSFAIASGGSTYYRNRINTYVKAGDTQAEAERKAMLDFQEIAEETQQSARPDRISQQQASNLGRIILAFANTPMQYNRLIKKAAGDLINKRGDWRANVSRILYYGAVQNFIFASLQNALFALAFDDEGDDEKQKIKEERIVNSMLDSILRGSGIAGATLATIKNVILEFVEQEEKGFRADYGQVVVEGLQVSPPLGSKARKLYSALLNYKYNKKAMSRMSMLDYNNPSWLALGNVVEATTNIPMARAIRKIDNLREAMNQENTNLQRLFLALGWSSWDLNVGERVVRNPGKENEYVVFLDKRRQAVEDVKTEIKEEKKQETIRKKEEKKIQKEKEQEAQVEANKEKQKEEGENATCAAISSKGKRCKRKPAKGGFCTVHEKVQKSESGEMKQCKKIKSDGKRCGMTTNSKSGLCYYHD